MCAEPRTLARLVPCPAPGQQSRVPFTPRKRVVLLILLTWRAQQTRSRQNAQGLVAIEKESDVKEWVVGFLVYRVTPPDTEILNVAVDPACTRRRIGTQMLHHLELRAVREGVQNLFLEVRPSNAPARDFYLKEKFLEVGRRKDYYSNPTEDAILMKREIGS